MKRIISILLILCISLSSTAIASAQSYKISNVVNSEIINAEEIVLHKDVEGSIILRGEDYANGNSCFFLIENGNVISSSYVDKTDATTTYTNYETMTTQTEKILRADKVSTIASMTTSGYTFAREVGFYLTKITQGESILGMFIIGSLVQRWVSISFTPVVSSVTQSEGAYIDWSQIKGNADGIKSALEQYSSLGATGLNQIKVTTLQQNLDSLIPGLAALLLTLLCCKLLKKKVSPITIIIALFVVGIIGRVIGIM